MEVTAELNQQPESQTVAEIEQFHPSVLRLNSIAASLSRAGVSSRLRGERPPGATERDKQPPTRLHPGIIPVPNESERIIPRL